MAGVQLNRFCASSLEAVNFAVQKVRSGWEQMVVAGGQSGFVARAHELRRSYGDRFEEIHMSNTTDPESVVRTVLAAIDAKDLSVLDTAMAPDVYLRFGNAEATTSRKGLAATSEAFLASMAGIRHRSSTC